MIRALSLYHKKISHRINSLPNSSLLEIQKLNVKFSSPLGTVHALKNVSFSVEKGSILGVVGESGCGKSTISNSILGLLAKNAKIESGEIKFEGKNLLAEPDVAMQKLRGPEIATIFQDPMTSLSPVLSIGRQMIDILYRSPISFKEKKRYAIETLTKVGLPDPETRINMYPHELSGGQRQRVCIAMAVMMKPKLLIADEATTALDATLEQEIIKLLKVLQRDLECTMLFVTHHLGVVASLCDKVVVMYDGEIKEFGNVKDVFGSPEHVYTRKLLRCDPAWIKQKTRKLPTMADDPDEPIKIFNGKSDRIDKSVAPVLEIDGLHVTFEKRPLLGGILGGLNYRINAVKDVNLSIHSGETLALVGESGSGKTTIARSIIGLQKVTSGSIKFEENELTNLNHRDFKKYRQEIAYMFQDPIGSLSPRMKVLSLLTEPFKIHNIPRSDYREEAIRLLGLVGLKPEFLDRYPHELSGGQARRIGVARAMALGPKLIVADEPTAGLDVSIQGEVLNLLAQVQDKTGVAILLITHNLNVVRHISDRVSIMYMGRFLEVDYTEKIFKSQKNEYTRKLIAANSHPEL